ncbi:hypothetical protein SCHPADRAFT_941146 [Schizopora paradoxa]|uniref:Uncharacterized protein n=1 Tax=Schizopora paradoxa TaxID=27342 RepID=A0A0H2RSS4_9AGAM|nr:hypothetical protein SCHPADRAFT_941146 [Schizopora paradoxa]
MQTLIWVFPRLAAMKKSTRVPAALHSEFTEYSSLLRALRTTQTLDLAGHLTRHQSEASLVYEDDEDEDIGPINRNDPGNDTEGEEERTQTETHHATSPPPTSDFDVTAFSSQPPSPPRKPNKRTAVQTKGGSKAKRKLPSTKDSDLWTRWPLLSGDVHVPEWVLDDEVRLIASRILKAERNVEDQTDEDAQLPSSFVNSLAADTAHHLARILAACALTAPTVPSKSLAGRLHPIGWEDVLASVSSCGLTSASALEKVTERMSSIHNASVSSEYTDPKRRNLPYERAAVMSSSKRKRDDFCAAALSLDSLLHFDGPPATRKRKSQKKQLQIEKREAQSGNEN